MNKQEIQTMIDSTIVPNKKKGITAESLRLVLKEMATATPEGGGTGNANMVKIYCPADLMDTSFNEERIEELIKSFKDKNPQLELDYDELREYLRGLLKKNSEAFKYIVESVGKADYFCAVSATQATQFMIEASNKTYEQILGYELYESASGETIIPLCHTAGAVMFTDEAKKQMGLEDTQYVQLYMASESTAFVNLHPDGSLSFESTEQEATSSSDFVKRIWIDEALDLEPTEEHIAENKATYEFFKNGGYALVTLCYNLEGLERFSLLCDTAQFFDDMFVSASASWDDNYYTHVSNTIGVSVQLYADGHIESDFKRSGYLTAYLPKDGEEYKDYNKEIYDIIKSGDVPSPIMIKAEHATYTSSIVAFENEEAIIVFVAGFDTNTGAASMGKMSIQNDGTIAIL